MTADEIAANRAAAIATVRASLNLTDTQPSDWTYDQRTQYNKALATYIQSHPDQFSDQDALTADLVSKEMYPALQDTSFDTSMFVAETLKPATDALQSVGSGVLSIANAAKWALPLAAILVAGMLLMRANREIGGFKIKGQ